jgi:hypothetical protein
MSRSAAVPSAMKSNMGIGGETRCNWLLRRSSRSSGERFELLGNRLQQYRYPHNS